MEKSEEKKEGWGGARQGSGRKRKEVPNVNITVSVAPDVKEKLQRYADERSLSLSKAFSIIVEKL